jgi:hypothetical protein
MTSLADVRSTLYDTLDAVGTATTYKRRQTNLQFPAYLVGWPQSMDVRPDMGGARDYVIDVFAGVEVVDDDSSDDELSALLEAAVEAILELDAHDVQPATDFGEEVTADGRTIIWCRLPVAVFA